MIKQISYQGNKQEQYMYTQEYDKTTIYEVDKEEIDVQVQINFIAPKNVINNNTFYVGESENTLQKIQLPYVGEYDSVEIVKLLIAELKTKYDTGIKLSDQDLLYQNKLTLFFTRQTIFKTEDYYFQKVLGYQNPIVSEQQDDNTFKISFPKRMYTRIARMLNVMCYFLKEPNYVQKGKKLFILLKTPYNFQPGENRIIQGESQATFSTSQLAQGFAVQFCDENYIPLELEGEEYYIDLFIQKSKRRVNVLQQLEEEKQAQRMREQQIQQYEQEKQKEREQYVNQQMQIMQQEMNAQFDEDDKDFQNYQKAKVQVLEISNQIQQAAKTYSSSAKTQKMQNKINNFLQNQDYQLQRNYSADMLAYEKLKKSYEKWDSEQRKIILQSRGKGQSEKELYEFTKQYMNAKIQKQQELQNLTPRLKQETQKLLEYIKEQAGQFNEIMIDVDTEDKYISKTLKQALIAKTQEINKIINNLSYGQLLSTQMFDDEREQFKVYDKDIQEAQLKIIEENQQYNEVYEQLPEIFQNLGLNNEQQQIITEEFNQEFNQENVQKYVNLGFDVKQISSYLINKVLYLAKIIDDEQFKVVDDIENPSGLKIIDAFDSLTQSQQKQLEQEVEQEAKEQENIQKDQQLLDQQYDYFNQDQQ